MLRSLAYIICSLNVFTFDKSENRKNLLMNVKDCEIACFAKNIDNTLIVSYLSVSRPVKICKDILFALTSVFNA